MDSTKRTQVLSQFRQSQRRIDRSAVIDALVAQDPEVYRDLLQMEHLRGYQLSPLISDPCDKWRNIAVLALDQGHSCRDILHATLDRGRSWTGKASEVWARLRSQFEKLQDDADRRIVEIGNLGAETVTEWEEKAKEREREEAVHGLW